MTRTISFAALLALLSAPAMAQSFTDTELANIDKNDDARVSREEYDAFTAFAFGTIDADKSGSLSQSEMSAHLSGDQITNLDANGDGTVSSAEFSRQMDENFNTADKDGDGFLN